MTAAGGSAAPSAGGVLPPVPQGLGKQLPLEGQSTLQLLQTFTQVQGHRAELYSTFHAGFKAFCSSREEARYNQLLQHLTALFTACSRRVLEIESALNALGQTESAALLRRVQEGEREKLQLTLSLQSLKQAFAFKAFSWQQPPIEPNPALEALMQSHSAHDHDHDHTHGAGCGCGGHGGGTGAAEPTEDEYGNAVQEATRELARVIEDINDALEEVRYALAEAQEQEQEQAQ